MGLALPPSLLGFIVRGDIDGQTIYTDRRGQKVFYQKAPPQKPASPKQAIQRARFRTAVLSWLNLLPSERADYERASLSMSLCMTGHNLYIRLCLRGDSPEWHALRDATGLALAQPPYVRYEEAPL